MAINIATGLTRNMTEYEAQSSTSLNTLPATKTFTINTGKAWQASDNILLTPVGTKLPSRMRLGVSTHNNATGAITATASTQFFEADVPSTTPLNVATGTQTLVTNPGLSLVATDPIIIARIGSNSVYMRGTVTSYNAVTGDLVANITTISGTGTALTDWIIASDVTVANWTVTALDNDTITLLGNAILNITQTPLAKLGNIVATNRGQVVVRNSSTTTPLVMTWSKFGWAGTAITIAALGKLDILGGWIEVGTGNNTSGQLFNIPATIDRPNLIEVETDVGTGVFKPWMSGISDRGSITEGLLLQQPSDFQLGTELADVFLFNATTQQVACVNPIPTGRKVRIPNIHLAQEAFETYLSADITATATALTVNYVGTTNVAVGSFHVGTERINGATRTANAYSGVTRCVWSSLAPNLGLDSIKSSDSRTIAGTGSFSFTINTGLPIATGDAVRVYSQYSQANFMVGTVTSYNATTGALVISVTSSSGSGTSAAWIFQFGKAWTKGTKVRLFVNPVNTTYSKYLALDNGGTALLENLSANNIMLRGSNFARVELRHVGSTYQTWSNSPVGIYVRDVATTNHAHMGGVSGGFQLSSLAGDVDIDGVTCMTFGEAGTPNAILQVAYCLNIVNFRNAKSIVPKAFTVNYPFYFIASAAKVAGTYFEDLVCVGGYFFLNGLVGIKINRLKIGERTSGIDLPATAAQATYGIQGSNSQNVTILNLSKLGSAFRANLIAADVACKDWYIYSANFDHNNFTGQVLINGATNFYLYNGVFGNARNLGGEVLANNATSKNAQVRNVRLTSPAPYANTNGNGYGTGAIMDGVTALSQYWTTSNNMVPNYKDTGPYYTLWDDNTATSGRIQIGSFADEFNTDMYDFSGAYLDTAGRLFLENAGDYVIMKTTEPIKSVTSFKNAAPTFEHGNLTANTYLYNYTLGATGSGFVSGNYYNVIGGSGSGGQIRAGAAGALTTAAVFTAGSGYQVNDVLTVTGATTDATITLTTVPSLEYRVALPSEDITAKPFVALNGASLSTALAGLSGYDSNVGFNMHVKMTANQTNAGAFLVNLRLPTNNDTNYKVDDAYIAFTNINPSDTIELRKASDNSLIKSWAGSTTPKTFFATDKVGHLAYAVRKNGATTLKQSANFALDVNNNGTVDLKESFITVAGALASETVEMRLNSNDSLLYTRTGSGQFSVVDADVGIQVYFVRINNGLVIASTKLAPKTLTTGDNGIVKLFAGDDIQIAQSAEISAINTKVNTLPADVWANATRTLTSGGGGGGGATLAEIEASTVLAKEATLAKTLTTAKFLALKG